MSREQQNGQRAQVTARLVEEGYVTLQDRMRTYRQAKHQGNRAAGLDPGEDPVILLQDAVQTFYELVRPYLADEPRLAEYWRGALAQHPDQQFRETAEALDWYREHSVGVWQTQEHTEVLSPDDASNGASAAVADGGMPQTFAGWHGVFDLAPSERVLSVMHPGSGGDLGGWMCWYGRFAVLGLREVDRWEVRERATRTSGDGFMAAETATEAVREGEPAAKVETAARMLVEVADELGAIASYEPDGERVHGTPVPGEGE